MRYEIRTWLGKYEKWLLTLYGKKSLRMQSELLDGFIGKWPRKSCLSRITTADVGDYLAILTAKYLTSEVLEDTSTQLLVQNVKRFGRVVRIGSKHIAAIDRFWRFLIIDCGLPLTNPAKPYLSATDHSKVLPRKQKYPRVHDFKKVYAHAGVDLKRHLLGIVIGRMPSHRLPPSWVNAQMNAACRNAGIKRFTMQQLKDAVSGGLWKEMIKDYVLGLGSEIELLQRDNSDGAKAQEVRDLWGDVQTPFGYVWPTIGNSNYSDPLVQWIT